MNLLFEKFHPYVFALLFGGMWTHFACVFPYDEKEFLSSALSLGAILSGFISTSQAILMALPGDSVMRQLRASGYIHELVSYIAAAFYGCMLFCLINILGFFLIETNRPLNSYFAIAWITVGVFAFFSFIRVNRLMFKIMKA